MELIFDLLSEVGVQMSRVKSRLKVIDGWQRVREVLHKREDLGGTETHKLGEQVARKLRLEWLGGRVIGIKPSEQCCLEIELELSQEWLIKAVFDLAKQSIYMRKHHMFNRI